MRRAANKKDSLYIQLLKLLVLSAAAAGLIFMCLSYAGDYVIGRYCYRPDYIEKRNLEYVEKLQRYIDEHKLHSRDADLLYEWVKDQYVMSIRIYKDGIQVFDTEYPEQEVWEENISINEYGWETYYTVLFTDGEAKVSMQGSYAYQFYNYAMIAELILSFLLFLLFVLLGIRTKMNYIRTLSKEIEILEGGSLDYKITVKGKDELAALAESLDQMRISFLNLILSEAKIVQENQKTVTEMSHDLRTPVTSILLYTEILKKGKYSGEEQLREYVEKIEGKARRMKQLTDHLFEYSLVTGETEIPLEEAESFSVLFYDLFSETCSYLEQREFQIELEVEWRECLLKINMDYVTRIMDNLTSNIIKYADPAKPIVLRSVYREGMAGFSIQNKTASMSRKVESTGVGIMSIHSMMKKMNGVCRVRQPSQYQSLFEIEILFPVCGEEAGKEKIC